MANIIVYVSRNGNSFNLRLSDSEGHNPGNDDLTTTVNPGDMVTWELASGSGLDSIVGILPLNPRDPHFDAASVNVFQSMCSYKNSITGSTVYTGMVVPDSPGPGKYEKYRIGFMVPNDATVYWDDPKIQMN